MTYISFCSGIEAATAAWHPLGWTPVAFCEIDKFACRVLAHHYPTVPNLGDFTKVDWSQYSADICVGGTPCQAFSVAGLRNSLSDERGNLTLEFVRAINIIRPHTVVWENVPGVLSTSDNAFGCFLAALVGCDEPIVFEQGWPNSGVVDGPDRRAAWRILDAQYFGLAQRRKRVFVVANSGDRPHPAEILLEWAGLRRDSPPSREKGEEVAGTIAARTTGGGGFGTDFEAAGGLQPISYSASSFGGYVEGEGSLRARGGDYGGGSESIVAMCLKQKTKLDERLFTAEGTVGVSLTRHGYGTNNQAPLFIDTYNQSTDQHCAKPVCPGSYHDKAGAVLVESSVTHSLRADGFDASEDETGRGTPLVPVVCDVANSLNGNSGGMQVEATYVPQRMSVRRLLPSECEALQGFGRGFTNIPGAADGPRYKALGNSMAVPVMTWIGRRIKEAYAND